MNKPTISKVLIDYLDKLIPARDWKPDSTMTEIQFHSGKRELILLLKRMHEEQKGK